MRVALNASAQGMRRAAERLAEAAAVIASPVPAGPSPAPPTGNESLIAVQAGGDVARALVDTILARRAYEANAKVLDRTAEAERAFLSRGA